MDVMMASGVEKPEIWSSRTARSTDATLLLCTVRESAGDRRSYPGVHISGAFPKLP